MAGCGGIPTGDCHSSPEFSTEKEERVLRLENPDAVAALLAALLNKVGLGRITITTNNLNHGLPKLEGEPSEIEGLLEMLR